MSHPPVSHPLKGQKTFVILLLCFFLSMGWGEYALCGQNKQNKSPIQTKFISLSKKLNNTVVGVVPLSQKGKKRKNETFREKYWRLRREKLLGASRGKVGSGVVLDSRGHILTSLAILSSRAKKVRVVFASGKTFIATILKRSKRGAFAILKLPTPWGRSIELSSQAKIGQLSATLGNPYNSIPRVYQIAISMGHITGRYEISDKYYKGIVLETDSAISQGSFGGPLVDGHGKMVGLVIPSYSPVRWMGVAVPTEKILPLLPTAIAHPPAVPVPLVASQEKTAIQALAKTAPYLVSIVYSYPTKNLFFPFLSRGKSLLSKRKSRRDSYYLRPRQPASGVVVEKGGYILTSAFNLQGTTRGITVITSFKKRYKAKVLAVYTDLDLALLKINAPKLGGISWADSQKAKLGQWLGLVGRPWPDTRKGNPLTFNTGILSSKHRFHERIYQTDCRMNYGNLGGAVVDLQGHLVGIGVRLSLKTGNSSGVSFFVPNHILRKILAELKNGKSPVPFHKGYLGLKLARISHEIAQIAPRSPAQKAGLQAGDQLLEVDHQKVNHRFDLAKILEGYGAGKEVILKVKRGAKNLTFRVKLASIKVLRRYH